MYFSPGLGTYTVQRFLDNNKNNDKLKETKTLQR